HNSLGPKRDLHSFPTRRPSDLGITKKALEWLRRFDWPGNVRELENAMERAVIIAQGRMIAVDDLPHAVRGAEASKTIEVEVGTTDRKSTRLNSSHQIISYAVFC